jgi:hypothetical protein
VRLESGFTTETSVLKQRITSPFSTVEIRSITGDDGKPFDFAEKRKAHRRGKNILGENTSKYEQKVARKIEGISGESPYICKFLGQYKVKDRQGIWLVSRTKYINEKTAKLLLESVLQSVIDRELLIEDYITISKRLMRDTLTAIAHISKVDLIYTDYHLNQSIIEKSTGKAILIDLESAGTSKDRTLPMGRPAPDRDKRGHADYSDDRWTVWQLGAAIDQIETQFDVDGKIKKAFPAYHALKKKMLCSKRDRPFAAELLRDPRLQLSDEASDGARAMLKTYANGKHLVINKVAQAQRR